MESATGSEDVSVRGFAMAWGHPSRIGMQLCEARESRLDTLVKRQTLKIGSKLFCWVCSSAFVAVTLASVALANGDTTPWMISAGGSGYSLKAQGSALDSAGAHVELASAAGNKAAFGTSVANVDATPYRGYTVRLSAAISTLDAPDGAGLWLLADGVHGRLAFANSETSLVKGTVSSQQREIEIDVPNSAMRLAFGTLLEKNGRAVADHLVLVRGEAIPASRIVPASAELDAAIKIVKENALHSSSVDWDQEIPRLHAQLSNGDWSLDAYPLIRGLLASLQDHHSHLLSVAEAAAPHAAGMPVALPTVEERQGTGYIALPGFNSLEAHNVKAYEDGASTGIARIAGQVTSGWVIDLRNDRGGNMWPMLAALRAFLGDGPLGYFKDGLGLSDPWMAQLKKWQPVRPLDLGDVPVAVLTGPHTASAGEAVVIALHGRPNTRFFGMPTTGVPTSNRVFKLPDGAAIALTVGVELDRNSKPYDGPIPPDVTVAASASGDGSDETMAAAQQWLRSVSPHAK